MKHNFKITIILLSMFVLTQLIGLYVIHSDPFHISDGGKEIENPVLSWISPPDVQQESDFSFYFGSVVVAFVIAILLLFLLTKFKIDFILRIWFFSVVAIALFITLNVFSSKSFYFVIPAAVIAIVFAFIKVFRRNFIVHNFTELLIYPGIASIFVPILNIWSIFILLILISVYDMWAVWHSGIMQKMAKYQINKLKVFSGFFVPYMSKRDKEQLKKMQRSKKKNKKIKINLAILGGGDVVFPIITAGVVYSTFHNLWAPLFVIAGATIGLASLFMISEKKKFYPAMPFITAGIFIALAIYAFLFHYILLL